MHRNLLRHSTLALGTLLVSSSLVFAAGMPGNVTTLDGKGMATVRTSDGKDHHVKAGQDFKVGSKVDCDSKNNVLECRLGAVQSAVPPTTPAPAATMVKPHPAPMAQTPAPTTVAPTAQTPTTTMSAHPAAMTPASAAQPAPAPTSSVAPSPVAPAAASK